MDATLAIVGGGKGQRFGGAAKGLIGVDGVPILQRQLRLSPSFAEVLFVANDASPYAEILRDHPSVRVVPDAIPNKGAPGGVHAALAAARTEWVVAIACDMPFVTVDAVQLLLAERTEAVDAIAFQADGRLHPLLAAYRASLHPAWGRALAADPPLRVLFATFRGRTVPQERLEAIDPRLRSLQGINEPKDLERL